MAMTDPRSAREARQSFPLSDHRFRSVFEGDSEAMVVKMDRLGSSSSGGSDASSDLPSSDPPIPEPSRSRSKLTDFGKATLAS
jgi:hypothetical protein